MAAMHGRRYRHNAPSYVAAAACALLALLRMPGLAHGTALCGGADNCTVAQSGATGNNYYSYTGRIECGIAVVGVFPTSSFARIYISRDNFFPGPGTSATQSASCVNQLACPGGSTCCLANAAFAEAATAAASSTFFLNVALGADADFTLQFLHHACQPAEQSSAGVAVLIVALVLTPFIVGGALALCYKYQRGPFAPHKERTSHRSHNNLHSLPSTVIPVVPPKPAKKGSKKSVGSGSGSARSLGFTRSIGATPLPRSESGRQASTNAVHASASRGSMVASKQSLPRPASGQVVVVTSPTTAKLASASQTNHAAAGAEANGDAGRSASATTPAIVPEAAAAPAARAP